MANKQVVYVTGKAKWARVFQDQMDTAYGEKFHITVYPDEASQIMLKQSGCQVKPKKDDEGVNYKFSRDNKKEFKPGDIQVLGPPKVLKKEGDEHVFFNERIGNGSIVTAKIEVYPTQKGMGHRLEAVCVDMHVPYEPGDAGGYKF